MSRISYIDGEKGILRYRGYPIEELAAHSNMMEVAYLVLFGSLPTQPQLATFKEVRLAGECMGRLHAALAIRASITVHGERATRTASSWVHLRGMWPLLPGRRQGMDTAP
jgi:citrate synthase